MRIGNGSSFFKSAQEVVDELKVRGNELKGVNRFGTVFTVVLVTGYNGEVGDKN